ncbi:hypothetical protein MTO96_015552 [Rhipicephalus appendiculatus]
MCDIAQISNQGREEPASTAAFREDSEAARGDAAVGAALVSRDGPAASTTSATAADRRRRSLMPRVAYIVRHSSSGI